jgi:hypothetical protein
MTPFELSLQHDLNVEQQRFDSDWLFKWYGMTYEGGTTDVEDFKGGRITYGGILFEGTPPLVFWNAVERYLLKQVHASFQRWDQETASYPAAARRPCLERTEGLIRAFVATVVQRAVKTDQALRGRGTPKTDMPAGSSEAHAQANAAIHQLALAHMTMIPSVQLKGPETVARKIGEALNFKPSFFGISIDLKKLFGWGK